MDPVRKRSLKWLSIMLGWGVVLWLFLVFAPGQLPASTTHVKEKGAVKSVLTLLVARQSEESTGGVLARLRTLVSVNAASEEPLEGLDRMAGPRALGKDEVAVHDPRLGVPLVGLPVSGGVVIGFSSGEVRYLEKSELGLDDGDAITFGAASKSPLLRMLCDVGGS